MKSIVQSLVMLLFACSLQNCQDNLSGELSESEQTITAQKIKERQQNNVFTLSAIVREDYGVPANKFLMYITGSSGKITINWGDGTDSAFTFTDNELGLEKIYAAPGRYEITITGDLKNIQRFQSSYGEGVFDSVNFKNLTGLESLRIGLTPGPEVIDLSTNRKLREVMLTDINELTVIRLPKNHSISSASIAGPNNLSSSTVDEVINSIYEAAVKRKIYNGYFNVMYLFYENPEVAKDLVGPPSSTSVAKLRTLQDVYGWEIVPSL
jgi:hypothetical protein